MPANSQLRQELHSKNKKKEIKKKNKNKRKEKEKRNKKKKALLAVLPISTNKSSITCPNDTSVGTICYSLHGRGCGIEASIARASSRDVMIIYSQLTLRS